MRKLSLTYGLLIIGYASYSQFSVGYTQGYSSSSHNDLIELQEEASKTIQLPTKTVNSFDPSLHMVFTAKLKKGSHLIGLYYLSKETGGRSGIKDATGAYRFDQVSTLNVFGANYNYYTSENFSIGFRIGKSSTHHVIQEQLDLYGTRVVDNALILDAEGIEINPLIEYHNHSLNWLILNLEVGYNIDLSKEFMNNGRVTIIKPNWTGIRVGFGIDVMFSRIISN